MYFSFMCLLSAEKNKKNFAPIKYPEGARKEFLIFPITLGIYEVLQSETEQNLGEGRADPRTVYPLLSDPNGTK
jgi:hypothetical protein